VRRWQPDCEIALVGDVSHAAVILAAILIGRRYGPENLSPKPRQKIDAEPDLRNVTMS